MNQLRTHLARAPLWKALCGTSGDCTVVTNIWQNVDCRWCLKRKPHNVFSFHRKMRVQLRDPLAHKRLP
jgi:hypothetical protein